MIIFTIFITISCNELTTDLSDHLAIVTTINLDYTSTSSYRSASSKFNKTDVRLMRPTIINLETLIM